MALKETQERPSDDQPTTAEANSRETANIEVPPVALKLIEVQLMIKGK